MFVNENSTIDGVDNGTSKIGRTKFKNTIIPSFLAKFKLLVKPSFRSGFLTLGVR